MASRHAGMLSPTPEMAPQTTDQPAKQDDSKNDKPVASASTMSHGRAATAPLQEEHPTPERDDKLRAQSLEYNTHLEKAKAASQPPPNKASSTHATQTTPPVDPRDTAATIAALRQQLYIAEQHILIYHNDATRHIADLENLIRTSWDRSGNLETNVNYLIGELHKANGYNTTLNQHVLELRAEAEARETTHHAALQAANAKIKASSNRNPPALLPVLTQNTTNTLLEHNRASILKLRAEIRELKASKKQLQERLLTLGAVPALDGSTFLQTAGLPREVLGEWLQVLLQRGREIAGLRVMIDREREAR